MSNGMSKNTYACFICEKNGYPDERVYLAGKDANGRTIYLEPDGVTAHQHKRKESNSQMSATQTQNETTETTIISLLKEIDGKLNRLLIIEGQ